MKSKTFLPKYVFENRIFNGSGRAQALRSCEKPEAARGTGRRAAFRYDFQTRTKVSMVWFLSVTVLLLLALLAHPANLAHGQEATSDQLEFHGITMGVVGYNVVIAHPPSGPDRNGTHSQIQSVLDRVNELMSTYRPESDVSRFNDSTSTQWQPVDVQTARVVQRALEISHQTDGAFDITVAPAVQAWHFGPGKEQEFQLPTAAVIAELKTKVGFQKIAARLDPPALKKTNGDVSIDLSAIAKGYAVDQVATKLAEMGFTDFMIEVGGEVFASGQRTGGGPWRIGVQRPDSMSGDLTDTAQLSGRAMATSGDYRQFKKIDAKRYSHTIDPTTCRPVEHSLASACVVAEDCMTADAFATAVMVAGAKRGKTFCEKQSLELLTISRDSDFGKKFSESATEQFPFFKKPSEPSESIWPAFIGALVIFSLAILGMAVGAIFGNKPIQGSCGGLANMKNEDGESSCTVCAQPTTDCVEAS